MAVVRRALLGKHGIVGTDLGQRLHQELVGPLVALMLQDGGRRAVRGQAGPDVEQYLTGPGSQVGGQLVILERDHGSVARRPSAQLHGGPHGGSQVALVSTGGHQALHCGLHLGGLLFVQRGRRLHSGDQHADQ